MVLKVLLMRLHLSNPWFQNSKLTQKVTNWSNSSKFGQVVLSKAHPTTMARWKQLDQSTQESLIDYYLDKG